MKENVKKILPFLEFLIIISLFILLSYLTQRNIVYLQDLIGTSFQNMIIYVFIFTASVIIAPINSEPLIPLASQLWGWQIAGFLTLIGWSIGSLIAFLIARHYGVRIVKKFVSLKKVEQFQKIIPQENIFWSIVFLRLTIQVDILSYVIGFLSNISAKKYFIASLIGFAPLAFILAYIGELPLIYQLVAFTIAILLLILGILVGFNKLKKNTNKKL